MDLYDTKYHMCDRPTDMRIGLGAEVVGPNVLNMFEIFDRTTSRSIVKNRGQSHHV